MPGSVSRLWTAGLILAGLLLVAGIGLEAVLPVNRDAAFMTYSASRVLAGLPLVMHFEPTAFNTVMFWSMASNNLLYAPAAALAAVTGLSQAVAIKIEAAAALAAVALALVRFCRASLPGLPLLLPAAAFVLAVFPVEMYAQREHMFVLLVFPWVLVRVAEAAGGETRLLPKPVVSAMMVAGLLIKPYFLAVWGLIELRRVIAARSLRPAVRWENAALVVMYGVVYGGIVAIVLWSYRVSDDQLEVAALLTHRFMTHSMHDLLIRKFTLLWVLAVPVVLLARGPAVQVWLLATIGGAVASIAQLRGHDYNWYPAIAFAGMTLAWVAATASGWRRWLAVALMLLQIGLALVRTAIFTDREYLMTGLLDDVRPRLVQLAAGGKVVFLTINHYPVYPLLAQTGLRSGLRFQTLGFVTGILEPDLQARLIGPLAEAVAQDVSAPDVRVVVITEGLRDDGSVVSTLLSQPVVRHALDGYRYVEALRGYEFYVRK